jgi:hypothetical protein
MTELKTDWLDNGVYFYTVVSKNGNIFSGKIVKVD